MKKSKTIFINIFSIIFIITYFFIPLEINNFLETQEVIADEIKDLSLKERRDRYFSDYISIYKVDTNIKILIVAGHDDESYGTEFDGIREVDLNRDLASRLYQKIKEEKGFNVALVSDQDGYTRTFEKYFKENDRKIEKFIKKSKKDFSKKIKKGDIEQNGTAHHNSASEDVAKKLYGINMWAEENDFDLVIHIHFNDYVGRYGDKIKKYNGFSIYVPEKQLENHEVSMDFAKNIFNKLSEISAVSNMPFELDGIIETQELIAIGSNETLEDTASILIEYGYIYEPQFTNPDIRNFVIDDLAQKTFEGLKTYFNESVDRKYSFFDKDFYKQDKIWNPDNYNLQKELAYRGFYPPEGYTKNDCPISGLFGDCTEIAVKDFQKENNLPSTGYVGSLTRQLLNN